MEWASLQILRDEFGAIKLMALTEKDLKTAFEAKIVLCNHIQIAKERVSGKMNPKGLEWHESSAFAQAAGDAERWIVWLSNEVRRLNKEVDRLKEYEKFYKDLDSATKG